MTRVLLLGDSFVQGLAVPIEETVARRLAGRLSEDPRNTFDVVSLAYGGASPEDELRLLGESGSKLDPDLVISVFYEGNDVMDCTPAGERQLEKAFESRRLLIDIGLPGDDSISN